MEIRAATPADAEAMSRVLKEIIAGGGRDRPSDATFVQAHYIAHPDRIRCSLALDEQGRVLGFQSLKQASASNPYGVTPGWGIIGTHVSPRAARRGVGAALFGASRAAAADAGLPMIDATIGKSNDPALCYYAAMGFRTYRQTATSVGKAFRVA